MTIFANPICVFQVLKDLNKLTPVLLPLEKMLLQVKIKIKNLIAIKVHLFKQIGGVQFWFWRICKKIEIKIYQKIVSQRISFKMRGRLQLYAPGFSKIKYN